MKKLLLVLFCGILFVGCKDGGKNAMQLVAQSDSLKKIIEQRDGELEGLMGTMNEIQEGFRLINEAEGRVTVAKAGEGSVNKEQIKNNMKFIQERMQQNRELIEKLRKQVREGSIKGEQMKQTIENLVKQLDQKDKELQTLREELEKKDIKIMELGETVANQSSKISNLKDDNQGKADAISAQQQYINSAWYVFGTTKELKEQGILANGDVLKGNYNKNYFTKIDIRVDKEIKFYSKSATILTSHPASSYTLFKDTNKQYVLKIVDPQNFWRTSKYLVVQVK